MNRPSFLGHLSGLLDPHQIYQRLRFHPVATLSAIGVSVLIPIAIRDYRTYLSYGPGGLPYNVFGWLLANTLRIYSREQLSPKPYDDRELPFANDPGFFAPEFPPKRGSSRPKLGTHPVPQRQLEQLPSPDVRHRFIDRFAQLGKEAEQRGLIEVRQSRYERQHEALFVSSKRPMHAVAQQTRGEISHVHAGLDGSFHVVLHPADCKKVLERGWGQRHAFSGSNLNPVLPVNIPVNYLLIYAPRNDAEVEIAITIIRAGIRYMTGAREHSG
ncbi:hypothetical protein GRF29_19g2929602 [Pseudopithomyces chartarum]|uniref:Luciferase domain-containing protein n=1 Tax=Pseudopithomyces chartarum TaxID=1892770 RepID=A0AAN6M5K2_9PLEO|nr:hypothetical protein GRF29_19g2929602 [Pseudopithomyces chartarum]